MFSQGTANSAGGGVPLKNIHEPWIFARMAPFARVNGR